MSIPEAAAALGVSANTVRAMIKRGEVRAARERRPQGYTLRVFLDEVPATAGTTSTTPGTSAEVPAESRYRAAPTDLQRAAALAEYAQAIMAPLVAELAAARLQIAEQAEQLGALRAQFAATETTRVDSPRPWWRCWWRRTC